MAPACVLPSTLMTNEINSPETLAALRQCVYSDLLDRMPAASMGQLREFLTNLYLPAESVNPRFLMLKVSPDIAETNFRGLQMPELMRQMIRKYGDQLDFISGFYRDGGRRIQLNLPKGCALYG